MKAVRLLHLEDDPIDAQLIRRTLESTGIAFDIVHTLNRQAFEAQLTASRFDLIITDYAIPGWNGLEALAAVREVDPEVPFVFVSGALGEERAVEALRRGATDYVLKDRLPRLIPVIERALAEDEGRRKRLQAERDLREAEEKYRAFFEQSPDAIVVLEPRSTLPLDFNNEACRQLGYSREEFRDIALLQLTAEDQPNFLRLKLEEALRTSRLEFETRFRTKQGEVRSVWINLQVIQIQGGPALHCIWRDTTDRKETERRLLRSQRLESIGTLAGGIAHDLNNALSPILMSSSLIRQGANPETLALIDLIETSAQRGAAMVRQLLTFAKGIEGQRIPLQPRHLLREMEKFVKTTFPKNIQFRVYLSGDSGLVLGDATQLHQVLLNLCVNARDAMPDGGKLTLHCEVIEPDRLARENADAISAGKHIMIRVTDSGTGITPDHIDRIFDPFFTTKGPDKGTGMGLATVLGIVRSHQGFIQVESKVGHGSSFSVYLPLVAGKELETEHIQRRGDFEGHGEFVLLIDDDAAVRDSVEKLLVRLNFRVLATGGGHEALISFSQRRKEISAVICDLQMPHMDGVAVVQSLQRMSPQAPVIVMSGNPSEAQLAELKTLGVAAVLVKPFAAKQLVETLRVIFEKNEKAH